MTMSNYSDMLSKAYAEIVSDNQRDWQAEFKLELLEDRLYQISISKKDADSDAHEILLEIFENGISIGDSYKRGILFREPDQLKVFLEALMLFLLSQMFDINESEP